MARPPRLHDVSFTLRGGEILGVAGLLGAGRTALARALVGADPPIAGRIFVRERSVTPRSPRAAARASC